MIFIKFIVNIILVSSRRRSRSSSFDYKGLVENAKKEEREALDTLRIIRDKQNAVKEEKHYTKGTSKKEGRKGKFNLLKVLFTPIEIPKNQNEKKSKRSRARYHSMCDNYSTDGARTCKREWRHTPQGQIMRSELFVFSSAQNIRSIPYQWASGLLELQGW